MTAPRYATCRCTHEHGAHDAEHAGMCLAAGCQCLGYVARTLRVTPAAGRPSLRDLIAAGKRSPKRSTVALAERADATLRRLYDVILAEHRQAATLTSLRSPRSIGTPSGVCPTCGKSGLRNVGAHRSHAHGWRKGDDTA